MPRFVPRAVVLRRIRVVLNDLWDGRLIDAMKTFVPLPQLTVASAAIHHYVHNQTTKNKLPV